MVGRRVRRSLEIYISVESITPGETPEDFNWESKKVALKQLTIHSKWLNSNTPLWNSPEFRKNRSMLSAFLSKFKPILNARRMKENPIVTYEGF